MLLALAALAVPAHAAPAARPGEARPLWVALPSSGDRARARAAGFGWAEGQDGDWFLLEGTPAMAQAAGLRWRVAAAEDDGWAPSSAEVEARLRALPAGTLVHIGESALGAPLLAVRFGEGGRALRVLGGHHGDEGSSVEVALAVAEALAAGEVALPADTEVWVVPAVNPDGLDAGTRYNARGVDLNRNYGWEWDAGTVNAGDAPFSEPETRAVRALARARSFDAGLTLHAGAQNLGWVWNWTADERPPEEPLLADLAAAYAAQCGAPGFWLTNGADWYVTNGDTTDWTYGAWGAYDFTLELTAEKSPPLGDVETYTAWHLDAILGWIATPPDLVAAVVDDTTGEPLPATVTGPDVAPFATPDGRVARWLDAAPGAWTVTAPGYTAAPLAPETRLVPTALLAALPSPRLLSRGAGPTTVTLPGAGEGALTLMQPGELDVVVPAEAAGAWTVDPTTLAPGAWTLVTDAGVVPRGLFVGEVDDRVALAEVTLVEGVLTLRGENFAEGAEAWSIGGPARATHALPPLSATADTLVFALDTLDDDVLVWVNGAWLSVVDVQGDPTVDPTPPPALEVVVDDEPPPEAAAPAEAAGTCAARPGSAPPWGPWTLAALLLARRRR